LTCILLSQKITEYTRKTKFLIQATETWSNTLSTAKIRGQSISLNWTLLYTIFIISRTGCIQINIISAAASVDTIGILSIEIAH